MAADPTYITPNYMAQGGAVWVIAGVLDIEGSGAITKNGVQPAQIVALVDSTGGTPGNTLPAPRNDTLAHLATDVGTIAASLNAQLNAILAVLHGTLTQ